MCLGCVATTLPVSTRREKVAHSNNNAVGGPIPLLGPKPCSLISVKLPWQKDDKTSPEPAPVQEEVQEETHRKGYTPPKGRPTPKRQEQEIARGVKRDPHGVSDAQRYKRRKELKKSMSKDEWKEYKKQERKERNQRNRESQERMAEGGPRFLPARDQGEERAYVRDWIDARRTLSEWVMPMALALIVVVFVTYAAPSIAGLINAIAMVVILIFAIDGIWLGRRANNAVRKKFPGTTATGFGLGFYAFSRASQPRKWRIPRPRVERGADV